MREPFTPVSPAEMRELQLSVLEAFDRHCRDGGLRYYIWAGTLLGAMRHGGYIPWDDDIDVAMPRADFERFRREFGGSTLSRSHMLHHLATDAACTQPIIKLADPRAMVLGDTPAPVGVNIDIFPLDRWPASRPGSAAATAGLALLFRVRRCTYPPSISPEWSIWKRALASVLTTAGAWLTTRRANRCIDAYLRRLTGGRVAVGVYHLGPPGKLDPRAYGDPSWLKFETLTLPAPADPDAVLTHLYGDWRLPPPREQQRGHARGAVVWVDAPTVNALRALDHRTRATVRDLAGLKAVAARSPMAGPGDESARREWSRPEGA